MISLSEMMTRDPIMLGPEEPASNAGTVMHENRIRHLPIVDSKSELLGLITQRDILAAASSEGSLESTGDLMREKVRTVTEDTDLRAAALTMQKFKIGCLPVLKGKKVVGIITDTDYVTIAINLLEQMEMFDEELDSDFLE